MSVSFVAGASSSPRQRLHFLHFFEPEDASALAKHVINRARKCDNPVLARRAESALACSRAHQQWRTQVQAHRSCAGASPQKKLKIVKKVLGMNVHQSILAAICGTASMDMKIKFLKSAIASQQITFVLQTALAALLFVSGNHGGHSEFRESSA